MNILSRLLPISLSMSSSASSWEMGGAKLMKSHGNTPSQIYGLKEKQSKTGVQIDNTNRQINTRDSHRMTERQARNQRDSPQMKQLWMEKEDSGIRKYLCIMLR